MILKSVTRWCVGLVAWMVASAPAAEDGVLWRRAIKDHIGRNWTNELIHFEVTAPVEIEPERCRLMVGDGAGERWEIPYQVRDLAKDNTTGEWQCKVWCVADLPMFVTRTFEIERRPADRQWARPLPVENKTETFVLSSGVVKVEIPARARPGTPEAEIPVPVLRMEHADSGRWIGGGHFEGVGALKELKTETYAGPVFTDAYLDYVFENGAYGVFLRVVRGTSVLLWREKKKMNSQAKLILDCAAGLGLSPRLVRAGQDSVMAFKAFAPAWGWPPPPRWTTVWDERKRWGVAVFAGDPLELGFDPEVAAAGRYPVDPAAFLGMDGPYDQNLFKTSGFTLRLTAKEKVQALLELGLGRGTRNLGLGFVAGDPNHEEVIPPAAPEFVDLGAAAQDLDMFTLEPKEAAVPAPARPEDHTWLTDPAQRLFSQYAYNPLDEIKDYVLDYDGDPPDSYPRCVFDAEQRAAWRARLTGDAGGKDFSMVGFPAGAEWREEYLRYAGTWLIPQAIKEPAGGHAELLREFAMVRSFQCVEHVLNCDTIIGAHNWITVGAGNGLLAAADLGMPLLKDNERRILRARMLLLGYRLGSDRFMCTARGWMPAFINMTQGAYMMFAFMPALFPEHPMAEEWRNKALTQYEQAMWGWGGPKEAWIECPHYAICALEGITAAAYAHHNASGNETLMNHPALRGGVRWLAKISTPPDPRQGGVRHNPAIGNTYAGETSSLYAYAAALFRNTDPAFAAEMRWMWEQQGRPKAPTLGSVCPGTIGLHELLTGMNIPAQAPDWKSEHLETCGVVLRNGFPGTRESMLYLIQGWRHDHYDVDQGGFFLWGKGSPLSLDWGYFGRDGAWAHNVVTPAGDGKIAAFDTQPGADYLHSSAAGWDRRILFVKDDDPLGPNFFVVRDSIGNTDATWRFWMHTPLPPVRQGDLIRALGHYDVDMDLWFSPSAIPMLDARKGGPGGIEVEKKSRRGAASLWGVTQYGLSLSMPGGASFLWVIYPRLAERGENGSSFASESSDEKKYPSVADGDVDLRLMNKQADELLQEFVQEEERKEQESLQQAQTDAWLQSTGRPARFTSIADGRGAKVESPGGTDYAFLGDEPFTYQDGPLAFDGTAGAVSIRGDRIVLTLNAGRLLKYGEKRVTGTTPQ